MDRGDAFERIVALLNEAMLDDARWPEASACIDETVGARGNVLTFGDECPNGDIELYFSKAHYRGEDRSAWMRKYLRDYHAGDEHLPRLRALPDSRIVRVADLFTEQERRTSRMYNEALVRTQGQRGLTVRLDGPGDSRIVWGIADPVDANAWSSSQVETVGRVLPHLRQYVPGAQRAGRCRGARDVGHPAPRQRPGRHRPARPGRADRPRRTTGRWRCSAAATGSPTGTARCARHPSRTTAGSATCCPGRCRGSPDPARAAR